MYKVLRYNRQQLQQQKQHLKMSQNLHIAEFLFIYNTKNWKFITYKNKVYFIQYVLKTLIIFAKKKII